MSFKFEVGQTVAYKPIGDKEPRLYTVTGRMPKEEQAFDLKYRIKSETEPYERSVLECQLSSDVGAGSEYVPTKPRFHRGSHA